MKHRQIAGSSLRGIPSRTHTQRAFLYSRNDSRPRRIWIHSSWPLLYFPPLKLARPRFSISRILLVTISLPDIKRALDVSTPEDNEVDGEGLRTEVEDRRAEGAGMYERGRVGATETLSELLE